MIRILTYLILLFSCTTLLAQQSHTRMVGNKSYELSNHLGNVLEVTTDRKTDKNTEAEIVAFNDYYPYGMLMEMRNGTLSGAGGYRYAFQAQEKDDGIKGAGNSYNYTYRMHDSRLGRFFAVDPLYAQYPYNSQYAFSENRVIDGIEYEGLETVHINISVTASAIKGVTGGVGISIGPDGAILTKTTGKTITTNLSADLSLNLSFYPWMKSCNGVLGEGISTGVGFEWGANIGVGETISKGLPGIQGDGIYFQIGGGIGLFPFEATETKTKTELLELDLPSPGELLKSLVPKNMHDQMNKLLDHVTDALDKELKNLDDKILDKKGIIEQLKKVKDNSEDLKVVDFADSLINKNKTELKKIINQKKSIQDMKDVVKNVKEDFNKPSATDGF